MHPEGPDDSQHQGQAGRKQAENFIREAHGLGRGQSRIPHLQDAVAGS